MFRRVPQARILQDGLILSRLLAYQTATKKEQTKAEIRAEESLQVFRTRSKKEKNRVAYSSLVTGISKNVSMENLTGSMVVLYFPQGCHTRHVCASTSGALV